jgi:hypothetical protein
MSGNNHTIFIVGCITFLSGVAMGLGFYLLLKGFQSGELLVTNGGVAGLSGLIGFLGGKMTSTQQKAEIAPPAVTPVEPNQYS